MGFYRAMDKTNRKAGSEKPQIERFRETAKELGCDDSEETFEKIIRKIARSPARTPSKTGAKPKKKKAR